MKRIALPQAQRGVTLIVGLIMLVVMTLMVTSAFLLSNTNLKAIGNMQFRDEVIAAANVAIEQVLASPFTNAPAAEDINVDINNDTTTDYVVSIAIPTCIRAVLAVGSPPPSTVGFVAPATKYNTLWDVDATITDASSGASVRVRQGARVRLTQTEKDTVCP